jgi:hypothetical protein
MKRFSLFILLLLMSCAEFRPVPIEPQPEVEPLVATNYYLSDLRWESAKNSYGPFEKDSSNASPEGGDGQTLTMNGVTFAKGLGMLAPAEIVYNLGGNSRLKWALMTCGIHPMAAWSFRSLPIMSWFGNPV